MVRGKYLPLMMLKKAFSSFSTLAGSKLIILRYYQLT